MSGTCVGVAATTAIVWSPRVCLGARQGEKNRKDFLHSLSSTKVSFQVFKPERKGFSWNFSHLPPLPSFWIWVPLTLNQEILRGEGKWNQDSLCLIGLGFLFLFLTHQLSFTFLNPQIVAVCLLSRSLVISRKNRLKGACSILTRTETTFDFKANLFFLLERREHPTYLMSKIRHTIVISTVHKGNSFWKLVKQNITMIYRKLVS